MFSSVKPGHRVLLIWSDLGSAPEQLQSAVEEIQAGVGAAHKVCVENVERLAMSGHKESSFDCVFSGCLGLATVTHDLDLLAQVAKLLAPGGQVTMLQAVSQGQNPESLKSTVVLSGLSSSSTPTLVPSFPGLDATVAKLGPVQFYQLVASKPQHEVGASRLLSFAKPAPAPTPAPAPPAATNGASVWTLEDMDDDTVELVDDQTLLAEEDLAKPDPASLRVCGTTGKRKACKDCSCGLKEELNDGKEPTTKSVTSSCGSCFLGDAFRCGSCPYLGMPAFKPGEKITLSDRQLNPDLREVA
jgi:hypothetical protein